MMERLILTDAKSIFIMRIKMDRTRIRYNKVVNGTCRSRQFFNTSINETVFVVLDFNTFKFRILDANDSTPLVEGGNTKNKSVLKIQAKRALEKLGVKFNDEERSAQIEN